MKCKHCRKDIELHANGSAWHHAGPGGKNRCQIEPYGYMAEPHGDPCTVLCIGHGPGLRSVAP